MKAMKSNAAQNSQVRADHYSRNDCRAFAPVWFWWRNMSNRWPINFQRQYPEHQTLGPLLQSRTEQS